MAFGLAWFAGDNGVTGLFQQPLKPIQTPLFRPCSLGPRGAWMKVIAFIIDYPMRIEL
jgi:hypothetical protein